MNPTESLDNRVVPFGLNQTGDTQLTPRHIGRQNHITALDTAYLAQHQSSALMSALKMMPISIFAMVSSLSLPIFLVAANQRFGENASLSLEQKILQPLVPYAFLVGCRTWFLWNRIGHRLNGQADPDMMLSNLPYENDTKHVIAALAANLSAFTNGMLVSFLLQPNAGPIQLWTTSLAFGTLVYAVDFFTDVVDAFRKHTEQKHLQGHLIAPFMKQRYVNVLFNHHTEKFGRFLREALPVISGIIRSQATTQVVSSLIKDTSIATYSTAITRTLGLMAYWATAYFAKYELIQLRDNLEAASHKPFIIENALEQSSLVPLTLLGKLVSGQILLDLLKKCQLSSEKSVYVTFVFAAMALMSLLLKGLHEYVSSTDEKAVAAGKEGLVMSYCFGSEQAIQMAPKVEIGITCVAVSLGAIGMFAQTPMLRKHEQRNLLTPLPSQIALTPSSDVIAHQDANDTNDDHSETSALNI